MCETPPTSLISQRVQHRINPFPTRSMYALRQGKSKKAIASPCCDAEAEQLTLMPIAFYPTPVLTSIKRIVCVEGRSLMNEALCLSEDLTVSPSFRVAEPRSCLPK